MPGLLLPMWPHENHKIPICKQMVEFRHMTMSQNVRVGLKTHIVQ